MSTSLRAISTKRAVSPPRLALLGTGVVGSAFVSRYQRVQEKRTLAVPGFSWLANSRALCPCDESPMRALEQANAAPVQSGLSSLWAEAESLRSGDIVVDATASESVADWHARWLSRGVHVVTANKLGGGSALARAQSIACSRVQSGAQYGDSATVGAGLPLLRTLRALVAGGDRIHRVEGVLSGSLAWLFDRFDGTRPFSQLLREARQAGFTEPDPRIDLSGEDVRRKLLILARAAGLPLQADEVRVDSLVPPELAALHAGALDGALDQLDAPLSARFRQARDRSEKLCFLGRFDAEGASVGLRSLPVDHPLCGGSGTDNRVAIFSDRYCRQPLLIQGPGAGAAVTAAALLDDVLCIVHRWH